MSTDLHAAIATEVVETAAEAQPTTEWIETALTVVFAATAVFFVSLISVLSGLL